MESVGIFILLIIFVYDSVEADELNMTSKAEYHCAEMTRRPFYSPRNIVGKWRVYYTWGQRIYSCTDIDIKPMSETENTQFSGAFKRLIMNELPWPESTLMVTIGKSSQLLMFEDERVSGRFRALENVFGSEFSTDKPLPIIKFAIKAFLYFKYLILLNCERFGGYLMARRHDTSVSMKEIISLVDDVMPGENGHIGCITEVDEKGLNGRII